MMEVLTSVELPEALLPLNAKVNDYDFVLAHWYLKSAIYRDYYNNRVGKRGMILDNGAAELIPKGLSISDSDYESVINTLQPDVFIPFDNLNDPEYTYTSCLRALERHPNNAGAIIHGRSIDEYREMAVRYARNLPAKTLFIPSISAGFLDYYNTYKDTEYANQLCKKLLKVSGSEYAIGRILMIEDIVPTTNYSHIHLLGSTNINEFPELLKSFAFRNHPPKMVTIDTSYPIKIAADGKYIGEEYSKPQCAIDDIQVTPTSKQLMKSNIDYFNYLIHNRV